MICAEHGIPKKSIHDEALTALKKIDWSGNIRELRNVIERLIILGGDVISSEDVLIFANATKKD